MIIVLVLIAAILIIAALRDTQGDLFAALKEDVPAFGVWSAALIALGMIGFIPGLKPVSRGLLALVVVVLFVNNYKAIVSGFEKAWRGTNPDAPAGGSGGVATGTGVSPTGSWADPFKAPGTITSGRRTVAGNAAVGGAKNSSHLVGSGIDYINTTVKKLRDYFGPGAKILDEGDHIHVTLPGFENMPYLGKVGSK